jgi:hypothetical protein
VRAEFLRDGTVVGTAVWDGKRAVIESSDPESRKSLEWIFRLTPVVVDDASLRSLGAHGESVIQSGGLEWFLAAASSRGAADGFEVRFVPEVAGEGGWDPAASYRTFRSTVRRLVERRTIT